MTKQYKNKQTGEVVRLLNEKVYKYATHTGKWIFDCKATDNFYEQHNEVND